MSRNKQKIGAVMVVGGGIGGIQASLDLAESGFKVYLVEKSLSIDGVMTGSLRHYAALLDCTLSATLQ